MPPLPLLRTFCYEFMSIRENPAGSAGLLTEHQYAPARGNCAQREREAWGDAGNRGPASISDDLIQSSCPFMRLPWKVRGDGLLGEMTNCVCRKSFIALLQTLQSLVKRF